MFHWPLLSASVGKCCEFVCGDWAFFIICALFIIFLHTFLIKFILSCRHLYESIFHHGSECAELVPLGRRRLVGTQLDGTTFAQQQR